MRQDHGCAAGTQASHPWDGQVYVPFAAPCSPARAHTSVDVRLRFRTSTGGLIQVCSRSFVAPIHRPDLEGIQLGVPSSALHVRIFFMHRVFQRSHRRTISRCRRNWSGREASTTHAACPSSLTSDRTRIGISEFSRVRILLSSAWHGGSEGVSTNHEPAVSTARMDRSMTRRGVPGTGPIFPLRVPVRTLRGPLRYTFDFGSDGVAAPPPRLSFVLGVAFLSPRDLPRGGFETPFSRPSSSPLSCQPHPDVSSHILLPFFLPFPPIPSRTTPSHPTHPLRHLRILQTTLHPPSLPLSFWFGRQRMGSKGIQCWRPIPLSLALFRSRSHEVALLFVFCGWTVAISTTNHENRWHT